MPEPHRHARASLIAALAIMVVWGVNFAVTKYALGGIGVGHPPPRKAAQPDSG